VQLVLVGRRLGRSQGRHQHEDEYHGDVDAV